MSNLEPLCKVNEMCKRYSLAQNSVHSSNYSYFEKQQIPTELETAPYGMFLCVMPLIVAVIKNLSEESTIACSFKIIDHYYPLRSSGITVQTFSFVSSSFFILIASLQVIQFFPRISYLELPL